MLDADYPRIALARNNSAVELGRGRVIFPAELCVVVSRTPISLFVTRGVLVTLPPWTLMIVNPKRALLSIKCAAASRRPAGHSSGSGEFGHGCCRRSASQAPIFMRALPILLAVICGSFGCGRHDPMNVTIIVRD